MALTESGDVHGLVSCCLSTTCKLTINLSLVMVRCTLFRYLHQLSLTRCVPIVAELPILTRALR